MRRRFLIVALAFGIAFVIFACQYITKEINVYYSEESTIDRAIWFLHNTSSIADDLPNDADYQVLYSDHASFRDTFCIVEIKMLGVYRIHMNQHITKDSRWEPEMTKDMLQRVQRYELIFPILSEKFDTQSGSTKFFYSAYGSVFEFAQWNEAKGVLFYFYWDS